MRKIQVADYAIAVVVKEFQEQRITTAPAVGRAEFGVIQVAHRLVAVEVAEEAMECTDLVSARKWLAGLVLNPVCMDREIVNTVGE